MEPDYSSVYRQMVSGYIGRLGKEFVQANTIANSRRPIIMRTVLDDRYVVVKYGSTASMQGMVAQAIANTSGATRDYMVLFAESMRSAMDRKKGLLNVHKTVATGAQGAVVTRYKQTVIAQKKVKSYRAGEGRLPGRLGAALAAPDFIRASPTGISFANTGMLDSVAAHWRRMAFGAGEKGKGTVNQVYPFSFFGQVAGTLGFPDTSPSEAFALPPGFFFANEAALKAVDPSPRTFHTRTLEMFYPLRHVGKGKTTKKGQISDLPDLFQAAGHQKLTRGIKGRSFLNAGLEYLAHELPPAYIAVADKWFEDAVAKGRGPAAKRIGIDQAFGARGFSFNFSGK